MLSIASALAWSAIPLGAMIGGLAIQQTGNVALVYDAIGALTILIPLGFSFAALGHAERYLPPEQASGTGAADTQRARRGT